MRLRVGRTRGTGVDWNRAQRALRTEVDRVVKVLRSVQHPEAQALGKWNVAEVAMHLSQAWVAVPGLAKADSAAIYDVLPSLKGAAGPSLIADIWDLGDTTTQAVDADDERNPEVLADRIAARAEEYFALSAGASADDRRAWLVEGAEVRLSALTCHLLNETIVHGWDIARGDGQCWDIPAAHAAMVFEGFLVPVLQALGPRDMVDQQVAAGLRATYELSLRGAGRHVWVFDDGALTIEAPSSRPVDCFISADPVALLLVTWGRQNQAPAIVKRQLVVSGPKAWLGPKFRSLMRNP